MSTQVNVNYDENGNPRYYLTVANGSFDSEGNQGFQRIEVPASSVTSEVVADPEGGSFQRYVASSGAVTKAIDDYNKAWGAPPPVKDYKRPTEISQNAAFQDINAFSGGQLEKIYDSINSGAYKIAPDKSALLTPYATFQLQPLGNGLYDIPIGARSGSYNVAIGINDKGEAQFDKKFLDAGAIRYQGGSNGGFLQNFVQDVGPVGNIALAVATGGASIPTQLAAQTAYNMIGGADFEDALKGAALNVALSEGVKASGLLGGDATKTSFAPEMGDELIPFDEGLTGIDIGDVIPATPEQLSGLYGTGGVFRPPMEGIDMGETIPFTPEQVEGLYPVGGAFMPEGIDVGDTIPYTQEQIAGLYPPGSAFLPSGYTGTEGIDTGDVIPTTPGQLEGLYPPGGVFVPPKTTTLPSIRDLANAAVIAGTVNSLVNPPSLGGGPTTGGGGFNIVPVPSDWKSPTYNQQFTPLDLNSLFTTANLLKGTQWENLPPEIQFVPTMEALTNIISNGQTSTSN